MAIKNKNHITGLVFAALVSGPAVQVSAQTQLLWGDLHLHTNLSTDAYATANKGIDPYAAYRFAKGIPIYHPNLDTKVQIDRPLDFLAITDHATNLSVDVMALESHPLLMATERGRAMVESLQAAVDTPRGGFMRYSPEDGDRAALQADVFTPEIRAAGWRKQVDAAEHHNVPGEFTTFFAWEWTSLIPSAEGIKNLHRNVISNADSIEAATQFIPFSNQDSLDPEDLFSFLRSTQERTGTDFVAIPHNSNISGGLMFSENDNEGRPIDAAYARERMRWELLMEITQVKGTSETHPLLSPNDEFANFENRTWLLTGQDLPPTPADYARGGLLKGMALKDDIGENPFKFGFVGASDGHIGMSSVEEANFLGKIAVDAKLSVRATSQADNLVFPAWDMSASGLTGVWAEENTRESIFAAFKRKEVYGTTGPRIALRVFGGFNFNNRDSRANDIAAVGYRKGVPMGSDLTAAPRNRAPSLLIHAAKDEAGANLDRVQVVKGWIDADGNTHERVYNVAWSGERELDSDGKLPDVGNTVNIETTHYNNTIGSAQLSVVWEDPDFDPTLHAFYYVRAIEIPTPRHSLFDALALQIPVEDTGWPATIQERAYSSPIWYTP
ncbi:MAG: DUF3604 domain-containing protein [Gammaproteobacteria bacterium]